MHFAVWAPNARRVSVVGDFNDWDGRRHPMRYRLDTGIWEIFIPDIGAGQPYKYEIIGPDGVRLPLKADPFAFRSELRPATASVTASPVQHDWGDAAHRAYWRKADPRREPISIYEVHAGSWQRATTARFLSWDELADRLIPYVVDIGFTHIEFLPITEHPYDPSWGYQTTGLYAPTARFGDPHGFARFVDGAHRAGIGVILDWVPAHFPADEHGLAHFDGTALYEHADPRQGFHPDWNTAIYNFGRREVLSFLVNNALYWAEKFHVDGLRVDAVASMLYLDYSRKAGEWIPNEQRRPREPRGGRASCRTMNKAVYGHHPGVDDDRRGIDLLAQGLAAGARRRARLRLQVEHGLHARHAGVHGARADPPQAPPQRHHLRPALRLLARISCCRCRHDEVVHGKGSLLGKMPGDDWQKFANLRAYYAFMWGYPGKKLLFMGQEFAQRSEWSEARALDWHLLDHAPHRGVRRLVRDLNRLYRSRPALHARDCEPRGLRLADRRRQRRTRSSPGCARRRTGSPVAVISNFTPVPRDGYRVPLPPAGRWREILNTDAAAYGGSGKGNGGWVEAVARWRRRGRDADCCRRWRRSCSNSTRR